jgi:uroporphyrinogen decarboxylase
MSPRERVRTALHHEEPDRVPVDLSATRLTSIMALAHHRYKRHVGRDGSPTKVFDAVMQLALPEQEILDELGVDVVGLERIFLLEETAWKEWTLPDGSPAQLPDYIPFEPRPGGGWQVRHADGTLLGEMPPGVQYLNAVHWPLKDHPDPLAITKEELRDAIGHIHWAACPIAPHHWPRTSENRATLRARAKSFYESTDYAVIGGFDGNLHELAQHLRRIDHFLMDLADQPKKVAAFIDTLLEIHLEDLVDYLEIFGDCIDVIQMGDDLGSQRGAQISPRLYREIYKPRHQLLYGTIKKHTNAAIFLHTCGSVRELLPDLIEAGIDILNPVQTSAAGMDPAELKREFGKDLVFWGGGVDTQTVLPYALPAEIDTHVRDRIATFRPGGGFIFAAIHNIPANVPPENLVALWEAVERYR